MAISQHTPLMMLRIRNHYSEFNPAMKQIADYLLDSGNTVFSMGIKQLATASGVSVASVTRFVRLLGFSSFKTFQIAFARSVMREEEKPLSDDTTNNKIVFEYGDTSPHDSAEEIGRKVFQSNIQMLLDTMKTIDYKKVEYVTDCILNARNLVFLGVGRSYITAESGRIRFYRLGINAFSYSDAQEIVVAATTCTKTDVFFGISNFGHSPAVVNNICQAKMRGATTIGITSVDGSPLTKAADTSFLTAFNNANMEYRTHRQAFEPACENLAQIALLDCIYMNVALRQDQSCFDMFYDTVKVLSGGRL
ncbi:MurR/RpiR family transcriptional regulator [Treponema primitia]|uniref:MurR/RpiR family transcriptional regulator n=1 Tax=Treponema primitia TaxID=88058 RepID=UPI00397F319B